MVQQYISSMEICSSRKNPYSPHGRSLEIPRGREVLKVTILEAKYKANLEVPGEGGRGVQNKKPSEGGVWKFSGSAQCAKYSVCVIKN